MKTIGIVALIAGALAFLIGFNMDTTVASGNFDLRRVYNIGLMNDRQNLLIFAGVISVVGAIFFSFASKSSEKNRTNTTKTTFNGKRDLNEASYQLYLTETFKIEKNSTLNKYVVKGSVFDTLPEALGAADKLYDDWLRTISKDHDQKEAKIAATMKRGTYIMCGAIAVLFLASLYRNKYSVDATHPPLTATDENSQKTAQIDGQPKSAADILAGKKASNESNEQYVIFIGAFSNPTSVKQLQAKIETLGIKVYTESLDSPEGKKTRVRAGTFSNREDADNALDKLRRVGINGVVAVKR